MGNRVLCGGSLAIVNALKGQVMDTKMTDFDKHNLLTALMRMEHKCTGSMYKEEYESAVVLAQELQAPQFIVEYFARKAITAEAV